MKRKIICFILTGLVYSMLDIPPELYTPIFAISRIAGWSAHRIEEITTGKKIIRPAYKSVAVPNSYVKLEDRTSSSQFIESEYVPVSERIKK